jgi:hypothetical protein
MDQLKKWVALSAAVSMLVLAAGWFLVVGPKRAEAADIRVQAAQQIATNSTLETQLQVLKAQAKDLPKEQAKLAAVAAKIPNDPALPGLVRALLEAAAASGVELVSVSPAPPELVVVAAPEAPVEPVQGQTSPTPRPRSRQGRPRRPRPDPLGSSPRSRWPSPRPVTTSRCSSSSQRSRPCRGRSGCPTWSSLRRRPTGGAHRLRRTAAEHEHHGPRLHGGQPPGRAGGDCPR